MHRLIFTQLILNPFSGTFQAENTHFVRESITVNLTSFLSGLDSDALIMFYAKTDLLVRPNPNQW